MPVHCRTLDSYDWQNSHRSYNSNFQLLIQINNKFDPVSSTGDKKTIQAYEESWTKAVDEAGRDDKTKNCVAVFECILPQQNWDEFTVNFICGGKPYTYTARSGQYLGIFESGKNYTLPLTVGKDEVIAGEITATPWADGGTSDLETD